MQKIRKRSFTNYQESSQLSQSLLNQVFQEQIHQNIHKSKLQSQSDHKYLTIALFKSKKAKVLRKFEKYGQKTARESTQNGKISTIQSLKRQVIALENQQILSYRLQNTKNNQRLSDQIKDNDIESEISMILKRFNSIKKEITNDKFRRKFLLFGNTNILTEVKTERSSIRNKSIQAQSDIHRYKSSKLNLSQSKLLVGSEKKLKLDSHYRTNSMSLTARKFYGRQDKKRIMTENDKSILSGMSSIKKLKMVQKTLSGSGIPI